MSKRFVFRVWHKDKKYMYDNVAVGVGEHKVGYKLAGKKRYMWEESGDVVIMQYTGYKDSKDQKIFEGDIVEFGKSRKQRGTIVWDDYRFAFKPKGAKRAIDKFANWKSSTTCRVVGNIYERNS